MVLKFRDKIRKSRRKLENAFPDEDVPPKKKGKQKFVFGVNNRKWYEESNNKDSVESLKMAAQENDFNEREKIFEQNRPALMKMIRSVMKRPAWKFNNGHLF